MHTQTSPTPQTADLLTALKDGRQTLPKPIFAICILGFIGTAFAVIGLLTSWSLLAAVGTFFLLYYTVSVAGGTLALVWLWQMKKRGAYLYAALFVTGQIVIAAYGAFSVTLAFLIGLAVTAIALHYSKNMK